MGMKVAYTGRKPQEVPYEYVRDLKSLAAAVDFLVVACPGGEATRNIVDAGVLAALGTKGTLVNIARGSIVDEPAVLYRVWPTAETPGYFASSCANVSESVPIMRTARACPPASIETTPTDS